jgi:MFS transporter, FSR family, fosmidomycin resistance protein
MFFGGGNKGTLIACSSAHMMNHIHMFILPALIPVFQRIFHLSYSQVSFLLASFFFGLAVLNPVAGIWAANHSKKFIVAVGICGGGFMLLFLASVDSYEVLLFVLLVYGGFLTFYHPAGTTILANSFEERVRGRVMGVHSVGSSLGTILGPLLIGFFLKESTYQAALWFFSFLSMAIGGLAIWLIQEVRMSPLIPKENAPRLPHLRELLRLVREQRFSFALISYGLRDGVYWGLFIFLPLYLIHQFRYSEGGAAGMLALVPLVGLLATITGGVVGDRMGHIRTMTGSMAVVGSGFWLIPLIPSQEVVFYLMFLIVTFAIFATVPLFDAAIADITPAHLRSVAYGYFFGLGCFLGGVVTVLGGILSDLFSPRMAFWVLGAGSFLCAYLVWSVGNCKPLQCKFRI